MIETRYFNPNATEYYSGSNGWRVHRLLGVDGDKRVVGKIDYFLGQTPISFAYLHLLEVRRGFRGTGYGSDLLEIFNRMIGERQLVGLLVDGINHNSPARGMYERHRWEQFKERPRWMAFNLPVGLATSSLEIAASQVQQMLYEM